MKLLAIFEDANVGEQGGTLVLNKGYILYPTVLYSA